MNDIQNKLPSRESISILRHKILKWYKKNKRDYPWRDSDDPFKLLIAEIMLRRTKANQVLAVYYAFFNKYPDLESVINAKPEEINKILAQLGLNWRIPTFVIIAKELKEKHNSKVPENRKELINLTGVGDYVAGAVLSIGFNKKEWIVDSNIARFYSRYFGIKTIKESRRDKNIILISKIYSNCRNPKISNLAILDFTSIVCLPKKPNCSKCLLRKGCTYIS